MCYKFTEDLWVLTLKDGKKFEEELTCRFKIGMRNFDNLTQALENLKNLLFSGFL